MMNNNIKPVIFDAMQFDGMNFLEVMEWAYGREVDNILDPKMKIYAKQYLIDPDEDAVVYKIAINTSEGEKVTKFGDYLIRHQGDVHICSQMIFEECFEQLMENKIAYNLCGLKLKIAN